MAGEPPKPPVPYAPGGPQTVDGDVRVCLVAVTTPPPVQQAAWDRLWALLLRGPSESPDRAAGGCTHNSGNGDSPSMSGAET
jgi:hypothetical protein